MADVRSGYARAEDGTQLYFRVVGPEPTPGVPALVCCNGVGVSTFFWKYIARHFRDRFPVVLWDYRGHGKSATPADPRSADLSMERNAKDLQAVLEAAGVTEPAVLLGHSMGCQVILETCRLAPERVRGLVCLFGTFSRPLDTFMDSPHSKKIFDVVNRLAGLMGKGGGRLLHPLYANPLAFVIGKSSGMVDRYYAHRRDVDAYLEHLIHMDPQVFLRMVEWMADHDLTDFLPEVAAPTLVFAGENDLFTPLHRSKTMVELIPDAELFVVAEGSHAAIVEHPETINLRLERFLAERVLDATPEAALSARA